MKFLQTLLVFSLLFLSQNLHAKNIKIIATGGTIVGAGDSSVGAKYSSSKLGIEKIIKTVPNLDKLANVEAEQLMQVGSQDLQNSDLLKISKKVNELLAKASIDGVVITHGTDTLEETAYFLNLTIKSKKPVVLVGAMRPATSLSADGSLNIYNAVALASSEIAHNKGALVMMNDEIFAAREATKTNTINVAAFKGGAIGFVNYGKVEIYFEPLRAHTAQSEFNVKKITTLPKVDILYAHQNQDAGMVDYLVDAGAKAIIVAGVGDGNVSKEVLQKLAQARKSGVVIVRSSRVGGGAVIANSEINDDELDFVVADNLNPQKARILTMLALTKTTDVKKIREMFLRY